MHQTFYIDVDEEISSVIDRLNKSMSSDNYFVVPKRALFLQSIVNLKILKREADKISKRVIIVTQDEIAISMAERSGIEACTSLEGLDSSLDVYNDQENEEGEQTRDIEFEKVMDSRNDKQARLSNIGSGEYYQSGLRRDLKELPANNLKAAKTAPVSRASDRKEKPEKIVLNKVKSNLRKEVAIKQDNVRRATLGSSAANKNLYKNQLDPYKAETLEKMYSARSNNSESAQTQSKSIGGGKIKKVFLAFLMTCALVFLGVGGYLFIPSAKIIIKSDISKKKIDMEIKAVGAISEDDSVILLRSIEKEEQFSLPFEVKGMGESSGKKARGTVVIYNEFSPEPQTLIATTRLETTDGKIFRLIKNVVVPGYSNIGGQLKPGVIQAEITADNAGDEYNIDATKFTIPGFAGGPKFEKFYASSDSATAGGSGDAQIVSPGTITQQDLDGAKQKAEDAFKEKMKDVMKQQLVSDEMVLNQAEKITITKSSSSAKLGSRTDSFDWIVTGSIKTLVFSENDVKNVVIDSLKIDSQLNSVKTEISKIDYGSAEPNFEETSLKLRVYTEVISTPLINLPQVKKELLGKSDDQLADILRKYDSIKSANVEFTPSFITRIPQYSSRVSVEVQNETN